jgi:hypothetical protein
MKDDALYTQMRERIDEDYRSRLAALNLVFFGKIEGGGHVEAAPAPTTKRRGRKKGTPPVKRARKAKKPATTRVDLVAYLEKAHRPFTVTDVMEATGASRFVASRAVKQALGKDEIKVVGKKATGGVPAPLYQRVA